MPETLVEMKNITKTFPGVKALDDAQLTLYKERFLGFWEKMELENLP